MHEIKSVFRFAPSPNGRLHLGHAYSALLNAHMAQFWHGRFLVRLEDIDTTRCTHELAEHCLSDLAWLGLEWEKPVRVQSQHWNDYAQALEKLQQLGLVYRCFCSRREILHISHTFDPDGAPIYPGTCRSLSEAQVREAIAQGKPYAWRFHMQAALDMANGPYHYQRFYFPEGRTERVVVDPARWGDVILARKETPTSYHLSVVVDDALQSITHIVRGKDLEAATDLHVLLQRLLALPTPFYHHHNLITTDEGEKLAKSKSSSTLADLRAQGVTAAQLRERFDCADGSGRIG